MAYNMRIVSEIDRRIFLQMGAAAGMTYVAERLRRALNPLPHYTVNSGDSAEVLSIPRAIASATVSAPTESPAPEVPIKSEELPIPPNTDKEAWAIVSSVAREISPKYKIPVSVFLTAFKAEEGGKVPPHNNIYGIKGVGPAGSVLIKSPEQGLSGKQLKASYFRAYHNVEECVDDYGRIISSYQSVKNLIESSSGNPVDYFVAIKAAGYATDAKYVDLLTRVYTEYNLAEYDKVVYSK
jgi:hypothetical protein